MKRRNIYFLVGAVTAGTALIVASNKFGEQAGARVKERLELIWPTFDSMSNQDKGLLAGYALTCQLALVELEKSAVLECLNAAANEKDPLLPKGLSPSQARAKLEQLIPRN